MKPKRRKPKLTIVRSSTTPQRPDDNAAATRRERLQVHLLKVVEDKTQPAKSRERAAHALQKLLSAPVTRVRQPPTPAKPPPPKKPSKLQKLKAEALAAYKGSAWEGLIDVEGPWVGEKDEGDDDDAG